MDILLNTECAIFDLDGTLIDSLGVWNRVDERFMERRGLPVPQGFYEKVAAMDFSQAADYVKNEFGLSDSKENIISEWLSLAQYEYANRIEPVDGAKQYLDYICSKGIKAALATASDPVLYTPCLARHNISGYFDVIVTTKEVRRKKGFPDIYLLAAEKSGVKPENCVVFEDILAGCVGAKAAGMRCVGVLERHSFGDWERIKDICDTVIKSYKEIMP